MQLISLRHPGMMSAGLGLGGGVLVGTEGLVEVGSSFLGDSKVQGYTQGLLWTL